jgi:hypothetical protein
LCRRTELADAAGWPNMLAAEKATKRNILESRGGIDIGLIVQ